MARFGGLDVLEKHVERRRKDGRKFSTTHAHEGGLSNARVGCTKQSDASNNLTTNWKGLKGVRKGD